MNKFLYILLAVSSISLITTLIYKHTSQTPSESEDESPQASRDFVQWMQTVPEQEQGGKGLKALIFNINPTISEEVANQMAVDLTEAARKYPTFCNTGNDDLDKQEFAAFLTIVGAETSFQNSFPCTIETGCPNCQACSYNTKGEECQTDPKKQYFGRGPLQLSWNYNYAEFSKYQFGDENILLNDPDLVRASPDLCWASAIWFWNQSHKYGGWCMPQAAWPQFGVCEEKCPNGPQSCTFPGCTQEHWVPSNRASCHDAIHGGQGFGQVMAIINGGYDCCPSSHYGTQYGHTLFRTWWFLDIYHTWTGEFQYSNLSDIQLQSCPLAKDINCGRMEGGQCYSSCCSFA